MTQVWSVQGGSIVRRVGQGISFVLGETKPTATNTGYDAATALTDVNTVVNATTNGAVYENMRFKNYVFVKAANVIFRNCEFIGPVSASFYSDGTGNQGYGLINCRSSAAQNTLIERCTIHPQNLNPGMFWLNGVSARSGATPTILRCNIYHTVDGVNAGDNSNTVVKVHGNYFHDLAFMNNSTDQQNSSPPYWTHNDGVQIVGGSNHEIIGNNFQSYLAPVAGMSGVTVTEAGYDDGSRGVPVAPNAWGCGITYSPDQSLILNTNISKNWLDGGSASFQMNSLNFGGASGTNVGYLGENRFGRDQYNYGSNSRYQIRYKNGNNFTGLTTNYFDPDSPTVPADKKGVTFAVGFDTGIRIDA